MMSDEEILKMIGQMAIIGVVIVFAANGICLVIGLALIKDTAMTDMTWAIIFLLALVGLVDMLVAYLIKRKLLRQLFDIAEPTASELFKQSLLRTTFIISGLCAVAPVYGLVAAIFGAAIEIVVGFSALSLIGFSLLRLRPRDFKRYLTG